MDVRNVRYVVNIRRQEYSGEAPAEIEGSLVYSNHLDIVRDTSLAFLYCDIPSSVFHMIVEELADRLDGVSAEDVYDALDGACTDAYDRLREHSWHIPEESEEESEEEESEVTSEHKCRHIRDKLPF